MDDQKQQIAEKLRAAKNVLITVSNNPSVDQLAACIALTLLLNKLDKHATAVYSGETPSTIEFLQPEETIEKNTDSLRDFIISLDKSKADKLRYKVEEKVVKIFITPYKTSLSGEDLEFSQGDFNVDIVVALGIHRQQEVDDAITAHGRILHDATIVTINNTPNDELGSIHWQDLSASSLSELVSSLARDMGDNVLDGQIATALLTGIVAETQRFRNNKTTPRTMSISAELMAAGANQQLVAEQLDRSVPADPVVATSQDGDAPADDQTPPPSDDAGTLEIAHREDSAEPAPDEHDQTTDDSGADDIVVVPPAPTEEEPHDKAPTIQPPVDLPAPEAEQETEPQIGEVHGGGTSELQSRNAPKLITEAPLLGGVLTANSRPEALDPALDPLGESVNNMPLLSRDSPSASAPSAPIDQPPAFIPPTPTLQPLDSSEPTLTPSPAAPAPEPVAASAPPTLPTDPHVFDDETLTEIEQTVHHEVPEEPKLDEAPAAVTAEATDLNSAREAVENAIKAAGAAPDRPDAPLEPVSNLGWQGQLDVQQLQPPVEPTAQPSAFDPNLPVLGPTPMLAANEPAPLGGSPADQPLTMPLPPSINIPPVNPIPPTSSPNANPQDPPPVPPPMMPPGFGGPGPSQPQQ